MQEYQRYPTTQVENKKQIPSYPLNPRHNLQTPPNNYCKQRRTFDSPLSKKKKKKKKKQPAKRCSEPCPTSSFPYSTCPSLACEGGGREGGKKKICATKRGGRRERARKLPSWGGGAALCTNVNPSVSGGGQRASGGQPPSGLFAGIGRVVVHTKLFNGCLVDNGSVVYIY